MGKRRGERPLPWPYGLCCVESDINHLAREAESGPMGKIDIIGIEVSNETEGSNLAEELVAICLVIIVEIKAVALAILHIVKRMYGNGKTANLHLAARDMFVGGERSGGGRFLGSDVPIHHRCRRHLHGGKVEICHSSVYED